jgi:nitroimidazol reductase NimA-like FMN-containing flavoprotein (pyridoxamine 5'-phosphate oxidase superfamily)
MTEMQPVAEYPFGADERPRLSWEETSRRLAKAETYWLATVGADGRPQVRPLLAIWCDGSICFSASPDSRKARNLAHDPRCSITVSTASLDLVVEGVATRVCDEATLREAAAAYAAKYGWPVTIRDQAFDGEGAPTAGPPPYHLYRITPTTGYGFGTDDTVNATRWRFVPE